MKKTISITISGIIFHIEDDGYDKLKNYLDSIHKYFASYEDSYEIVSDIENRIAEKFFAKLTPEKQVITIDDVNVLVASMGSTADFAEAEANAAEDLGTAYTQQSRPKSNINFEKKEEPVSDFQASKKLYRDRNRKLLGGVASGIAHYFGSDPLWVRLIFACFFFGLFIFPPITGFMALCYIILWIVVPPANLSDNSKVRKLYRDSSQRVVGGVASGIAAYFNVDVTIVRLLLVLGLFLGGSSLLIYILLWAITPEAKTLTEKMEMQGEPVTLDNIEKTIKNSLNVPENQKENLGVKALLFPFRAIATIFNGLFRILKPITLFGFEAARIFIGGMMVFLSFIFLIACFMLLGVLLGFINSSNVQVGDIPAIMLAKDFPVGLTLFAFFGAIIPIILVGLGGLALLTRRLFITAIVGWIALGAWLLMALGVAFYLPSYIEKFNYTGRTEKVEYFNMPINTLHLELQDGGVESYHSLGMVLKPIDIDSVKTTTVFKAKGENRDEATKNATFVSHRVIQRDSTLLLDDNISFNENAHFRAQSAMVNIYIPYNKPFKMTRQVARMIENEIDVNDWETIADQRFMFTHEKGLICQTCPPKDDEEMDEEEGDEDKKERKVKRFKRKIKISADGDTLMNIDIEIPEKPEVPESPED